MAAHNRGGHVRPGYKRERDEAGLTPRERQVLTGLQAGKSRSQLMAELDLTKQRISALCKSIADKGVELPVKQQAAK